jgi:hypothetical protein
MFRCVQQLFDVDLQMRHGVGRQVGSRVARVWCAAPAPPLVEQDYPVNGRVEESPPEGAGARAGATVQHQCRLTEWVAAALPIDKMAVPDVKQAVRERCDLGIQSGHFGDPTVRALAAHSLSTGGGNLVPSRGGTHALLSVDP